MASVLLLFPIAARAAITVDITQPASGAAVCDTLDIAAGVSSTYQLNGVQAQVGAVSGAMTAAAS